MKCQQCQDREATVHLKEVTGGKLRELHLCEICANEKGFHLVIEQNKLSIATQFIWMAENLYPESSSKVGAVQCDVCGLRYSQFSRVGRVGCAACYDAFGPQLQKILLRIHGATKHKGRIPGPSERAAAAPVPTPSPTAVAAPAEPSAPPTAPDRDTRLRELRERLREAIESEAYEEAAEIRDEIRTLEQDGGPGMIPILEMVEGPIRWLEGDAPDGGRILSSRVRLARNLEGTRFVGRALPAELEALGEQIDGATREVPDLADSHHLRMAELPLLDRQFLLERHLVSHDLTGEAGSRGLVVSRDEKLSVMIHEEDHVRIQALAPGFQLRETFEEARAVDRVLESRLAYSTHPELGYMTACPTNVGTGMRASVLVHLPGLVLSQKIKKILAGIQQVGLTVRGFYGEGSEVIGNFFQISNQVTLGETEEETLEKLERVIGQLLDWEAKAQEGLLRDAGLQIEDKVLRALGTLKYSRLLGSQEMIGLLSAVRFGHTLGMRNVPPIPVLNDLLLRYQPAHLQRGAGREMASEERNSYRAQKVQETLGVGDVPRRDV